MSRALQLFLMHFAHPQALYLFGLFPLLWALALAARYRRRRAFARLGSRPALRSLTTSGRWQRLLRSGCWHLGVTALVFACAGPRWGFETRPALALGRDLVVALDLSRSMLAQDVLPSRLQWAKQQLGDLARQVRKRGGHRLGLVAFAGRAKVVCPLTPDYDHFEEALAALNPDDSSFAPKPNDEQPASGTRIGLGLRQAVQLHDPRFRDHQDVLLLSDGDDPAGDNEWRTGAADARANGTPVSVLGVGNPDGDSDIPDARGGPLVHDGRRVRTRLREAPLQELARHTGGVYRRAWDDPRAMAEWFRDWVQPRPVREVGDDLLPTYQLRYAWFFAAALGFLAVATSVSDRPTPKWKPSENTATIPEPTPRRRAWWLVPAALLAAGAVPAADAERFLRAGAAACERGAYGEAVDLFTKAEDGGTDPGLVAFNKAAALYRLGRYRDAELHYLRSLEDAAGPRRARVYFDLGNSLVQECAGQDADTLDRAIHSYEECLRQESAAAELAADARHNLELAQALRAKAKARKKDGGPESDPQRAGTEDRNGLPQQAGPGDEAPAERPDARGSTPRPLPGEPGHEGDGRGTRQPAPGAGNLPPVPDSDELAPLSPEDAAAHLARATARILDERRKQQQARGRPSQNVLDW